MALHSIFSFSAPREAQGDTEPLYDDYIVRYDDVADEVQVYDVNGIVDSLRYKLFDGLGSAYVVAGIRFVRITNFPYAKKDTLPPVYEPLVLNVVYKTNTSAQGVQDGFIQVQASGGRPYQSGLYDYNINAGVYTLGGNVFSNLAPGTYSIGTKDSAGQTATIQVSLEAPAAPEPPQNPTYGCKDVNASNYDAGADIHDQSLCEYPAQVLTEVKVIEVRPCPADGVMLRWICNLGNPDCWMFSGKVDNLVSSVATGEYDEGFGLKANASRHLQPSVVLNTRGLDYNRFMAISQVFSSQYVVMEDEQGNQTRVRVEPTGEVGTREPGRRFYDLQVKISLYPLNAPN